MKLFTVAPVFFMTILASQAAPARPQAATMQASDGNLPEGEGLPSSHRQANNQYEDLVKYTGHRELCVAYYFSTSLTSVSCPIYSALVPRDGL